MYDYLIIDAQNLYWRAVLSSLKKCLDKENHEIYSSSIRYFLDKVNDLKNIHGSKDCQIYLLFDNPLSTINKRKTIDVEYKHSRDEKYVPKNFYKTLDKLQEILRVYKDNLYIVKYEGLEADDLVLSVLNHINETETDNDKEKLVISADMDWARSIGVDERVTWYNYVDKYTKENFKEKYEFSPDGKKIQMYKAIHGDNSDSIPNAVPYLPKHILLDIVENYKTVDNLLENLWNNTNYPQEWKTKIKESEKRIRINYRLVDYADQDNLKDFIFRCTENVSMLRFWFKQIDLQFETRMYDDREDLFFEQKKYRRLKK